MHWFDPLTSTWQLPCIENQERVGISLSAFRQLQRLEGSSRPGAYRVDYQCPLCQNMHYALLTSEQLDWQPVQGMPPSFLDLKTGKADWPVELAGELWARSIQKGRWPLHLCCRRKNHWFGGWPSLLSHLEPDHPHSPRQLLVHYHCPVCERADFRHMLASELQLQADF